MSTWYPFRKEDLLQLASKLGIACDPTDLRRNIIKKITEDAIYNEKLAIAEMLIIQENRVEKQHGLGLRTELEKEGIELLRNRLRELETLRISGKKEIGTEKEFEFLKPLERHMQNEQGERRETSRSTADSSSARSEEENILQSDNNKQSQSGSSLVSGSERTTDSRQVKEKSARAELENSYSQNDTTNINVNNSESTLALPQCDPSVITNPAAINNLKFAQEQKNDSSLKQLWEKAENGSDTFKVENNALMRISKDPRGNGKVQLVKPEKVIEIETFDIPDFSQCLRSKFSDGSPIEKGSKINILAIESEIKPLDLYVEKSLQAEKGNVELFSTQALRTNISENTSTVSLEKRVVKEVPSMLQIRLHESGSERDRVKQKVVEFIRTSMTELNNRTVESTKIHHHKPAQLGCKIDREKKIGKNKMENPYLLANNSPLDLVDQVRRDSLGSIERKQSSDKILVSSYRVIDRNPRLDVGFRKPKCKFWIVNISLTKRTVVMKTSNALTFITTNLMKKCLQRPLSKRAQRYATFVTILGKVLVISMWFWDNKKRIRSILQNFGFIIIIFFFLIGERISKFCKLIFKIA